MKVRHYIFLTLMGLAVFTVVTTLSYEKPRTALAGAGAFVQIATSTGAVSSIASVTMTSQPTSGNLLVVCAYNSTNAVASMPAYWTRMYSIGTGSGSSQDAIAAFYRIATSSESSIANVTWGSGTVAATMFAEYSGVDTVTPLNIQGAQLNASDGGSYKSPTVTATTTTNGVILTACQGIRGGLTAFSNHSFNSSQTGVTARVNMQQSASNFTYWDAFVSSASGTYEAEASTSANSVNGAGIMLFSQSAGGGGGGGGTTVQPAQAVLFGDWN